MRTGKQQAGEEHMSNIYYSAKNNGFYHTELEDDYKASPEGWPDDAVIVSDEQYQALLKGQANGKVISADNTGNPTLTDPIIDWRAKAEAQRQSLLTAANAATADWRTELQLDVISEEDKASLIKWMAYIKALKALELSRVSDEAGYSALVWPEQP